MSTPYKMKGSSALGYGNQHSSTKGMPFASPAKDTKKDPDYDKDHQKEYDHIDYGGGDVRHKAKSPAKHTDDPKSGSNMNKDHADAHNKRHADGGTHGEVGSKDNKWTDNKEEK